MEVEKEIVCVGGGVGEGVCGAAFTCGFASWCVWHVNLEVAFFSQVHGQKCL